MSRLLINLAVVGTDSLLQYRARARKGACTKQVYCTLYNRGKYEIFHCGLTLRRDLPDVAALAQVSAVLHSSRLLLDREELEDCSSVIVINLVTLHSSRQKLVLQNYRTSDARVKWQIQSCTGPVNPSQER